MHHNNLNINDLFGEIWKPIINYENFYWVSNMGRIKSKRCSVISIKRQTLNKGGYLSVGLCVNYQGTSILVHRIVVSHFVGTYTQQLNSTNHKNCIRTDNRDFNLEICDHAYNNQYAYDNGSKKPVMMIGSDNPSSSPVVQIDLSGKYINEFITIKDACENIKLKGGFRIYKIGSKICANKGFVFMLKDEYDKTKNIDGSINLPTFRTHKTEGRTIIATRELRKIVQLDDNDNMIEVFDSYKLAENKIGKKGILDVCRKRISIDKNGNIHKCLKCGGYKWMYFEDYIKS